jgi:XRE family transcriptional regulator, regulator of sulfur utilization
MDNPLYRTDISNIQNILPVQDPVETHSRSGPPAVGERMHALRKARKLSLDELSMAAGVSKSMLSQIERNKANPTVAVLWRLTNALNVALAEFLTVEQQELAAPVLSVVPSHATPVIKSPDGKCVLRILGPVEMVGKIEWYELRIEPGGVLSSEPHQMNAKEHLSVLRGNVVVDAAGTRKVVRFGETARYPVDVQHSITNEQSAPATALLVVEYG